MYLHIASDKCEFAKLSQCTVIKTIIRFFNESILKKQLVFFSPTTTDLAYRFPKVSRSNAFLETFVWQNETQRNTFPRVYKQDPQKLW